MAAPVTGPGPAGPAAPAGPTDRPTLPKRQHLHAGIVSAVLLLSLALPELQRPSLLGGLVDYSLSDYDGDVGNPASSERRPPH